MARRWLLLTDILSVAIGAIARFLKLLQFSFDSHGFWISCELAIAMTRRAGVDWHIGRQTAQRAGARDVDVASRAFQDVLALAAFVRELCRDPFRRTGSDKCFRRFVTTRAIRAQRLLRFPVTFETSVVCTRHRLERMKQGGIRIRRRQRHDRQRFVRYMTKRAVVVVGFLVLWHRLQSVMSSNPQRCKSKRRMLTVGHYSPLRSRRGVRGQVGAPCNPTPNPSPRAGRGDQRRNHVLVFVMRKFDFELALILWLRSLIRTVRFAESEAAIFARRGTQVTDSTDRRASADRRLTREELRPVATHARVVIRKISRVRKCTTGSPRCRNLVTGVALETFVFVGRV